MTFSDLPLFYVTPQALVLLAHVTPFLVFLVQICVSCMHSVVIYNFFWLTHIWKQFLVWVLTNWILALTWLSVSGVAEYATAVLPCQNRCPYGGSCPSHTGKCLISFLIAQLSHLPYWPTYCHLNLKHSALKWVLAALVTLSVALRCVIHPLNT